MASSTKLVPFFQKIDSEILRRWKETVIGTETLRGRLEDALKKDTSEYRKLLKEKFKNE